MEALFTQDSKVEDLFCGNSSGSEPSLLFINYFFSLGFKPIQDDFQHDFSRMTDEADNSVFLAELQVAFLGSVIISYKLAINPHTKFKSATIKRTIIIGPLQKPSIYSTLFYPITLKGRRGTKNELATIPFHLVMFSAALVELAKSIPVHSMELSSHLFFCLPLSPLGRPFSCSPDSVTGLC